MSNKDLWNLIQDTKGYFIDGLAADGPSFEEARAQGAGETSPKPWERAHGQENKRPNAGTGPDGVQTVDRGRPETDGTRGPGWAHGGDRERPEAGDPRRPDRGRPAAEGTGGPGAARGPGRGLPETEGSLPRSAPPADDSLEDLIREVMTCKACALHLGRRHAVPGEGVPTPLVMVIGEGPGADEDATGRPFVGRAGQYLDKWLSAIDLSRETNCFIANVVKCRPPGNRDPLPNESGACRPYLDRQIALLQPKAILSVGRISTQLLLGREEGIGRMRGSVHRYAGIPLVATYHPSGVLRRPEFRAPVWEDLKLLKAVLEGRA